MRRLLNVCLTAALMLALPGCALTDAPQPKPARVEAETIGVGVPVDIGGSLFVTMVSADTSLPVSEESSPAPGPHWVAFETRNSGETSATFPGRPVRPTVTDANGVRLEVPALRAGLEDGGGGWGPATGALGQPYANPGGALLVWFNLPGLVTAPRPITIVYAPTRSGTATFTIE